MSDDNKQKLNNASPRWWRKMKIWQVVFLVITPMAASGEVAIYLTEANPAFHGVVVFAGVTLGVLVGRLR